VSRDELLDRLRAGSAAVLDMRPEDEFANGHLPEALNIPLAQLDGAWPNCRRITRSSPIAAARDAFSHSRPSHCSVRTATGRSGWRMDFPNGKRSDCRPAGICRLN
jgi:hypothetical protein